MNSFFEICSNYDDFFCLFELKDVFGVIFYWEFLNVENVIYVISIGGIIGVLYYNLICDLVDSYFCLDGKICWNSLLYKGDKDMYDEFSCWDY